jgi:hypothetical protein
MPNNTINPYNLQPYQTPQQQGFGWVTTLINALFNNINYPVTTPAGSFLYYGTNISPTTSTIDVSDYNTHAFSSLVTVGSGNSTGSVYVSSSIDGLNWVGDFVVSSATTTSSINRLSGRRHYFMATYVGTATSASVIVGIGNSTASLYLLSGQ